MIATKDGPAAHVLGVDVNAVNMEGALEGIAAALQSEGKGYVCLTGVHGVMEAYRSAKLAAVHAGSVLTLPDGMPLVWVGRMQGHSAMERVAGPDLMLEVFRCPRFRDVRHFLYGGGKGVAEELRANLHQQFPWANIVGTYTPPFRELSRDEEAELLAKVHLLQPNVMWIGLGTPKQELFMARYLPVLETKLMFGVGAAFDYRTGRIRDCAPWIKRYGLQWLHRLLQDPKRLWRRYLRNNPAFLWHISLQMLKGRRSHASSTHEGAVARTPMLENNAFAAVETVRTQKDNTVTIS